MSADRWLPLFPLNLVLFPNASMPLHVFEDRYKLMMQDCLDGDSRFGVVLIKAGSEVGEPAIPHSVGTVAQIAQVIHGEVVGDGSVEITHGCEIDHGSPLNTDLRLWMGSR